MEDILPFCVSYAFSYMEGALKQGIPMSEMPPHISLFHAGDTLSVYAPDIIVNVAQENLGLEVLSYVVEREEASKSNGFLFWCVINEVGGDKDKLLFVFHMEDEETSSYITDLDLQGELVSYDLKGSSLDIDYSQRFGAPQ